MYSGKSVFLAANKYFKHRSPLPLNSIKQNYYTSKNCGCQVSFDADIKLNFRHNVQEHCLILYISLFVSAETVMYHPRKRA